MWAVERQQRLNETQRERAEIEAIRMRSVPTSKQLDLDAFVSRQDMH
eukprot:SAG11_NODE_18404_length_492_cov_0.786260_1_plen_46_part_10